jgi:hypothetical protein
MSEYNHNQQQQQNHQHQQHQSASSDAVPASSFSAVAIDTSNNVVPAAPYPPMNANYYNNIRAPSKSSLSTSPHYTTTYGRASSMSSSLVGEHIVTTNATTPSLSTTVSAIGGGGYSLGELTTIAATSDDDSKIYNNKNNNNNNSSTGVGGVGGGGGVALSSQIMFCPDLMHDDIVATINCVSPSSLTTTTNNKAKSISDSGIASSYGYGSGSGSGDSSISVGGKQRGGGNKMSSTTGPIMMELRRVEIKRNPNGDDDDDNDNGSSHGYDEFFTTRTVAVSRGLPSLGISVASTCLDLASSTIVNNYDSSGNTLMAATGSTTGALCIHKFNTIEKTTTATIMCDDDDDSDIGMGNNNNTSSSLAKSSTFNNGDDDDLFSASPIEYFHTPRHHRKASAVAWRTAVQTNHVAIGLVGTNTTVSGGTKNHHSNHHHHNRRGGPISMRASASDREYCCFLWDIVDTKKTTMPLSKFAYNSPVASLAWMMDGQTLAVGGQQRTIQLYDLRMLTDDNNKLPPLSAHAHESGVHGIEVHPFRPNLMATFCRAVGEPVKLFDIRRMDSVVSEIRLTRNDINTSGTAGSSTSNTSMGTMSMQRKEQMKAEAIQWSMHESGMLSVATGESVQEYDTNSGSRPNLVRVNRVSRAGKTIRAIALYRGKERRAAQPNDGSIVPIDGDSSNSNAMIVQERKEDEVNINDDSQKDCNRSDRLLSLLYPQRMLAVLEDQTIVDMAKDTNAPLAISRRDGRLVHALGPHLFMGKSSEGPSAMEKIVMKKNGIEMQQDDEDISATMMRRARCLQKNPYSMDPELNIKLMSREIESDEDIDGYRSSLLPKYSNYALLRLWSWIERVESLSFQEVEDTNEDLRMAKGLLNTGIIQILGMDTQNYDGNDTVDEQTLFSETFACNIYDGPTRRVALSLCGWAGKFDLTIVMAECEAFGEHERSAALAVWHEDVGAAVEALQRASESIRLQSRETEGGSTALAASLQYAETLDLISMCIAGYGGKTESQRGVWRRACSSLLLRDDLSSTKAKHSRVAYLRALCEFLMNAGTIESLVKILENSQLSLCDRVAFSCRFLEKKELMTYLVRCVEICQNEGDLEGLAITSLSKPGIKILQSFVDQYTDVQTAALVVSRVILPLDWAIERKICFEWVESYRSLLNYWQMWQTRAMFDVDRAEVLRRVKARSVGGGTNQRRHPNPRMRQSPRPPDPDILPCIPAQLEARCNYCSSPLSLKRNEGITNQWLSKMQPLLNCCPQCRKPLPRCSICLLSMGSLNPYMELTRARQKGTNAASADNLSSLSSMNFAEWYTWCMR